MSKITLPTIPLPPIRETNTGRTVPPSVPSVAPSPSGPKPAGVPQIDPGTGRLK